MIKPIFISMLIALCFTVVSIPDTAGNNLYQVSVIPDPPLPFQFRGKSAEAQFQYYDCGQCVEGSRFVSLRVSILVGQRCCTLNGKEDPWLYLSIIHEEGEPFIVSRWLATGVAPLQRGDFVVHGNTATLNTRVSLYEEYYGRYEEDDPEPINVDIHLTWTASNKQLSWDRELQGYLIGLNHLGTFEWWGKARHADATGTIMAEGKNRNFAVNPSVSAYLGKISYGEMTLTD